MLQSSFQLNNSARTHSAYAHLQTALVPPTLAERGRTSKRGRVQRSRAALDQPSRQLLDSFWQARGISEPEQRAELITLAYATTGKWTVTCCWACSLIISSFDSMPCAYGYTCLCFVLAEEESQVAIERASALKEGVFWRLGGTHASYEVTFRLLVLCVRSRCQPSNLFSHC